LTFSKSDFEISLTMNLKIPPTDFPDSSLPALSSGSDPPLLLKVNRLTMARQRPAPVHLPSDDMPPTQPAHAAIALLGGGGQTNFQRPPGSPIPGLEHLFGVPAPAPEKPKAKRAERVAMQNTANNANRRESAAKPALKKGSAPTSKAILHKPPSQSTMDILEMAANAGAPAQHGTDVPHAARPGGYVRGPEHGVYPAPHGWAVPQVPPRHSRCKPASTGSRSSQPRPGMTDKNVLFEEHQLTP